MRTSLEQIGGYAHPREIKVQRAFLNMLPRPTEKEFSEMLKSIRESGQENPIIVDQDMVLIDGHTRLEICRQLRIQVYYQQKSFPDRISRIRHMAISNIHRRHLTQYQKVLLYDELFQDIKKESYERMKRGAWRGVQHRRGEKADDPKQPIKKSIKVYAEQIGVTPYSVYTTHFIRDNGNKKINEAVKSGKMDMYTGYWKSRELKSMKAPKTYFHKYVITIMPDSGSQWKILRKLSNEQRQKIINYIKKA